jgi:hypothetical protein
MALFKPWHFATGYLKHCIAFGIGSLAAPLMA